MNYEEIQNKIKEIDTSKLSDLFLKKFGYRLQKFSLKVAIVDKAKYVDFSGFNKDWVKIVPTKLSLTSDSLGLFSSLFDKVSISLFEDSEILIDEDNLSFSTYIKIKVFNVFENKEELFSSGYRLVYNETNQSNPWALV